MNPVSHDLQHLDEHAMKRIVSQPGVVALSVFYEGFPVRSYGNADFEHIAALAEDLTREGKKIVDEMKIGSLDQLILETPENKLIIAPFGDMFLCVYTTSDAPLGLIRILLKGIQTHVANN